MMNLPRASFNQRIKMYQAFWKLALIKKVSRQRPRERAQTSNSNLVMLCSSSSSQWIKYCSSIGYLRLIKWNTITWTKCSKIAETVAILQDTKLQTTNQIQESIIPQIFLLDKVSSTMVYNKFHRARLKAQTISKWWTLHLITLTINLSEERFIHRVTNRSLQINWISHLKLKFLRFAFRQLMETQLAILLVILTILERLVSMWITSILSSIMVNKWIKYRS